MLIRCQADNLRELLHPVPRAVFSKTEKWPQCGASIRPFDQKAGLSVVYATRMEFLRSTSEIELLEVDNRQKSCFMTSRSSYCQTEVVRPFTNHQSLINHEVQRLPQIFKCHLPVLTRVCQMLLNAFYAPGFITEAVDGT